MPVKQVSAFPVVPLEGMENAMKSAVVVFLAACLASAMGMLAIAADESPERKEPPREAKAADREAEQVAEARLRSRLLHEAIHGALQVMHRDYFGDGGRRLPIPSDSLRDVFSELEETWKVKVRWLAVNAKVMNPRNRPQSEFDESAVKAITDGAEMFEATSGGVYQYAGKINLGNQCLKCHVPQRTSLEDRKAAVVITMPLNLRELTEK
jgi:hypothetical protein